ncbi:MAG: hypothetical protein RLZZ381_483, partial [Cyanobacteriota bacterium]
MKLFRHLSTWLLILLVATTLLLSGCSSAKNSPTNSDIQALQSIYEQNDWEFQESNISFKVHEKGAFTVSLAGQAIEKGSEQSEYIFIPIALFRKLPQFYKLQGDNSNKTELLSYKLKDGLWSMVAIVPVNITEKKVEEEKVIEAKIEPKLKRINIDLLIISPDFENNFPLSIPVGQSKKSIEVSVLLPEKYSFTSLNIKNNEGVASRLVKLPSALSQNEVKAVATLQPKSSASLDFSKINYHKKLGQSFSFYQKLFLILFLIVCAVILYLLIHPNITYQYFLYKKQDELLNKLIKLGQQYPHNQENEEKLSEEERFFRGRDRGRLFEEERFFRGSERQLKGIFYSDSDLKRNLLNRLNYISGNIN